MSADRILPKHYVRKPTNDFVLSVDALPYHRFFHSTNMALEWLYCVNGSVQAVGHGVFCIWEHERGKIEKPLIPNWSGFLSITGK